ncbi:hypothetical protein [Lysinibacillus telephonicus]|uniref:Nucleotidyltransferase domain-containing protein n=2 Tax=Lysinibacillus telephonicus TaxID=1714840 RepID=A0A3S0KKM4_9BACI|nr:hypothetical protein [Lysinibacillus telephonicus]RTQ94320.1 hypothetical protein EKG35_06065 [Lysinibacillus telephonicus]
MTKEKYDEYLYKYNIKTEQLLKDLNVSGNDIVFISGSVIEGFSNMGSDLDVYIIYNENFKFPENSNISNSYFGYEYTILTYQIPININLIKFKFLTEFLDEYKSKLQKENIDFSDIRKVELYHRLLCSYVIKNSELFDAIILKKMDSKNFKLACTLNRLAYSENRHDDAVGALESKDFLTAYINARSCLEKAVESIIFINGQTNPKEKWIIKRLYSVFSSTESWVPDFISLYVGQLNSLEEEELKDQTKAMVRLAFKIRNKTISMLKTTKEMEKSR